MRLPRPYIPLEVRCRVAMRQVGELWPDLTLEDFRRDRGGLLELLLGKLASLLNCGIEDLQLDHDPALGAREKVYRNGEHVGYRPDANDPEHLYYRERGSHRLKTLVRGDGAQYPDRVLIKRQRKREKEPLDRWADGKRRAATRKLVKSTAKYNRKYNWPKRPLRSTSRWPARGTRKIGRKNREQEVRR